MIIAAGTPVCSVPTYSDLVQLVEQAAVNRWVTGSSPVVGATFGVWRSLAARSVWVRKVVGSNPATPTILRALRLMGTVGNRPEFALKIQNKTESM